MGLLISVECSCCGSVNLLARDIFLRIESGGYDGEYLFVCPLCNRAIERPADRIVINLLLASGVRYEVALPSPPENPITEKEIYKFSVGLYEEEVNWRKELGLAP